MSDKIQRVCCWIGDDEGCRQPTILGKSYCETHYERVYDKFLPETANYLINKEINAHRTLVKYKQR